MPTEPAIKLNDCRKCGSDAVLHEQKAIPGIGANEFIVCCDCCTQKSEWKPSASEAQQSWNEKNRPRA